MRDALIELRTVTDAPIVAVIYTHFHYVSGTQAILDTEPVAAIWGHARIEDNLRRSATEIAPAYGAASWSNLPCNSLTTALTASSMLVSGVRTGCQSTPFTGGHVPATHTFAEATTIEVAGLTVEVTPAPSDADDSVTLWMPTIGVAVHNILWPALFNVFAIRGEEYRDPRILLTGLDHLHSLGAEHLVATHGPPLSGATDIDERLRSYRDSIQFLWDQTVRWTNRGATSAELAHRVRLPERSEMIGSPSSITASPNTMPGRSEPASLASSTEILQTFFRSTRKIMQSTSSMQWVVRVPSALGARRRSPQMFAGGSTSQLSSPITARHPTKIVAFSQQLYAPQPGEHRAQMSGTGASPKHSMSKGRSICRGIGRTGSVDVKSQDGISQPQRGLEGDDRARKNGGHRLLYCARGRGRSLWTSLQEPHFVPNERHRRTSYVELYSRNLGWSPHRVSHPQ